nr:CMRF35-like molecule 5 [Labrus bergylta]
MKIFAYACCLLSALSAVQMKTVNIDKHVGENVTIRCSGWDVLMYVEENVKYFCSSPCTEDKHVIIKAGYEKINRKDRIKLFNNGEVLSVTFTDLQKSDAGKYYCGVEIVGIDAYIEVNVNVKDAEPSSPIKTPITVTVTVTTTSPVTSPHVSDGFTDMSTTTQTLNTTTLPASVTKGAGSPLYWIVGLIVTLLTLLTAVLMVIRRMMKKQQTVVTTPQQPAGESGAADRVYQSLQSITMDEHQVYSTITPNKESGAADGVYQSLQLITMDEHQVYSTITTNKANTVL